MTVKDMSADVVADTKHIFQQPPQRVNPRQWQPPINPPYHRGVYVAAQTALEAVNQYDYELEIAPSFIPWSRCSDEVKSLALERVNNMRLGQKYLSFSDKVVDAIFRSVAIAVLRREGAL